MSEAVDDAAFIRVANTLIGAAQSAALSLQIFTGADVEDCAAVAQWAALDPHEDPLKAPIDEAARRVLRLRQFENALYDHASWDSPGDRWQ
jgi:hypothetical protein